MRVGRRVVMAAILTLAGLWIGTQWSAAHLSSDERGPSWVTVHGYTLYRPYQGMVWWVMGNEEVTTRLLPGIAMSFGGFFMALMLLRVMAGRRHQGTRYLSGARWATRDEIFRSGWL